MPGEFEPRPEDSSVTTDEGVALALDDRGRQGLALELLELRLVVEEVELARGAGLEEVDDSLRLDRKPKCRQPGCICGELTGEQGGQGDPAETDAAVLEEVWRRV